MGGGGSLEGWETYWQMEGRVGCAGPGDDWRPRLTSVGGGGGAGDDRPLALSSSLLVQPPLLTRLLGLPGAEEAADAEDLRHGHDAVQPLLGDPDLPAVDVLHHQSQVLRLHLLEDDDWVV